MWAAGPLVPVAIGTANHRGNLEKGTTFPCLAYKDIGKIDS